MKLFRWIATTASLIGLFLVVGHMLAKKSVHHEILINGSPDQVWSVLTDMASYPEWNPTMQLVKGSIKEGEKVSYEFTDGKGTKSTIAAMVKKIVPNELLNQAGGIPGIITYNHRYQLEPVNGNQTKVTIHEDYRGVYVWFWNPDTVQDAYANLNEALARRVENSAPKTDVN